MVDKGPGALRTKLAPTGCTRGADEALEERQ
jgi:hypothetical protein